MTREVLDALPTGRNIQAVGIMIPGTNLAVGGGGALSRDVGGSGSLQQSPLQYRGSGDTVQTIEGLRLNNLEAQGQVQRRVLERRELRGTELHHGRRFRRDGTRRHARQHGAARWRQCVPRPDLCQLRRRRVGSGQLRLARRRSAVYAVEPLRQHRVQPEQPADQRVRYSAGLGLQPIDRRATVPRQALVSLHVQALGRRKNDRRQLLRQQSLAVRLRGRHEPPRHRRRLHREQCRARVVAGDR